MINPLKLNPLDAARQVLRSAEPDQRALDAERVERLFRNRAELKKAYSEVQEELFRLKDRLKQQEGATARVQEMLEHLEERLGRPEMAHSTLVFYQLRRFWRSATALLCGFAADQEREHADRERRVFLAALNREQFDRRNTAETAVRAAEAALAATVREQARLQGERGGLGRPWHHFKRKEVEAALIAVASRKTLEEGGLQRARGTLEAILVDGEAPFPGLSVAARRAINLSLVAYAELLTARFGKSAVPAQARAAARHSEACEDYGSRQDCESLLADIARSQQLLEQNPDLRAQIRVRVDQLAALAGYASPNDTVPDASTLCRCEDDIMIRPPRGSRAVVPPNVLADDSWDIQLALRR